MTLPDRLRCNALLLRMMAQGEIKLDRTDLALLADDLDQEAEHIDRALMRRAEVAWRRSKVRAA